jgi:hypothetical protein
MQGVQAVPLVYSLEGTVTAVYDMSSNASLSVGDRVEYGFLIDDEISNWVNPEGETEEYGHTVTPIDDEGVGSESHAYYTEFLGGTGIVIDENTRGYSPQTGHAYGQFSAREMVVPQYMSDMDEGEVIFNGYGSNGSIQFNFMTFFSDWQAADSPIPLTASWSSLENLHDGSSSIFDADLTLSILTESGEIPEYPDHDAVTPVDISPTSVPEPNTFLMVFSGLLGMRVFRKVTT